MGSYAVFLCFTSNVVSLERFTVSLTFDLWACRFHVEKFSDSGISRRFEYQETESATAGFMTSTPQAKHQAVFSPPKSYQVGYFLSLFPASPLLVIPFPIHHPILLSSLSHPTLYVSFSWKHHSLHLPHPLSMSRYPSLFRLSSYDPGSL